MKENVLLSELSLILHLLLEKWYLGTKCKSRLLQNVGYSNTLPSGENCMLCEKLFGYEIPFVNLKFFSIYLSVNVSEHYNFSYLLIQFTRGFDRLNSSLRTKRNLSKILFCSFSPRYSLASIFSRTRHITLFFTAPLIFHKFIPSEDMSGM